jgi:hypothetical protein
MIIYDLRCDNDHCFEGWFRSAEDFEGQLKQEIVLCPQCDSPAIRRVPSAVAISSGTHENTATTSNIPEGAAILAAGTQLTALYRQLVQAMVGSSEDVGTGFAEEARKIHYNETHARPIHGSATADEFESLQDEGIPVLRIPKISEEDLN